MSPPEQGTPPMLVEVVRSIGRIEGKLDNFTELVRNMQTENNNFDSRLATLELANAARSQLLERLIDVEKALAVMQKKIWTAIGAGGVLVFLLQVFLSPIVTKLLG